MASTKDQKLMKATHFPPEFSQKVDMKKIQFEVMKSWIERELPKYLGVDDEFVADYCCEMLQKDQHPDIKQIQHMLTGYTKTAPAFCEKLWKLLLSAQSHRLGVPQQLLDEVKNDANKMADAKHDLARKRQGNDTRRDVEKKRSRSPTSPYSRPTNRQQQDYNSRPRGDRYIPGGNRENRDSRDSRDSRDNRDMRRDTRDSRDSRRDYRDNRHSRRSRSKTRSPASSRRSSVSSAHKRYNRSRSPRESHNSHQHHRRRSQSPQNQGGFYYRRERDQPRRGEFYRPNREKSPQRSRSSPRNDSRSPDDSNREADTKADEPDEQV